MNWMVSTAWWMVITFVTWCPLFWPMWINYWVVCWLLSAVRTKSDSAPQTEHHHHGRRKKLSTSGSVGAFVLLAVGVLKVRTHGVLSLPCAQ